jgi:outer membrane protein assembly factor BamB
MAKIALRVTMPFLERVTMPAGWARWLARQSQGNAALAAAPEVDGTVTWDYAEHGLAPWMQFFYGWRFADLTGDGRIDFVLTGGARRQIAYRQDGTELWRYEDPLPYDEGGAGFLDIRLDTNFPIADIDRDGVPELVCARKVAGTLMLCVVNARTGEVKRQVPYPDTEYRPSDCRGSVLVASLQGQGPTDLLVSWDYASIVALDADLTVRWRRTLAHEHGRQHTTMGHTPYVADIDGDGRDEIMAGSCLLNADGSTRWVAPDLPALVADGHADSVKLTQLRAEGPPNVVMSTGAYCFTVAGDLLWGRDELKHGQALHVGKLREDVPGKQVVIYEGASRVDPSLSDRVLALTATGELLWDFPVVQPGMQEGGFGFWLGDWNGDGLDEVLVNEPEKVNILNGHGEIIDTLPGHLIHVFDLVGDDRVEAVVLTGIAPGFEMQVWTNDAPNVNPATDRVRMRRVTTRAMTNCTRY